MKQRILAFCLAFTMLVGVFSSATVYAAETKTSSVNDTVSVNGTFSDTIETSGGRNNHSFTMAEAGELSIGLKHYFTRCASILVYDTEGKCIWQTARIDKVSSLGFGTYSKSIHLKAGTYTLQIFAGDSYDPSFNYYYGKGDYDVTLSYTSANESIKEPNDTLADAVVLKSGDTVNGQLAINDRADYFTYTVTKPGKLSLDMTSYMAHYDLELYDVEGNTVWSSYKNAWNNNLKKVQNVHDVYLAADTYYLKVYSYYYNSHNDSGNYTLKTTFTPSELTYTGAHETFADAYPVTIGSNVKGQLSVNDKIDVYKLTLQKTEEVNLGMTAYIPSYTIYLYNQDGKKIEESDSASYDETAGYSTKLHSFKLEAGTYYFKVDGRGKTGIYNLNVSAKIQISEATASIDQQIYTGDLLTPNPTVTYGDKILVSGTDYTVKYANNREIGEATATITGIGEFTGTKTITFKIIPIPVTDAVISKISSQTYNGYSIKPKFTVTLNGKTLIKDKDYTIYYKNNKNAGKATVGIKGIGIYSGKKEVKFTIKACKVSKASYTKFKDRVYTGQKHSPSPVLKYNGIKLVKGKDYTISYKNNTKIGTATITITGKGNFTGTKTITFKILPKTTTISKVANSGKTGAKITWKRDKNVTGYEIYRSTNKYSGYKKVATIKKNSIVSYTNTKLSKNKKYYYKVRSYKVVNGKKYYGAYSSIKSVKTKNY